MSAPTSSQLLEASRAGDVELLGRHLGEVASAIRSFADAGDGASALELAAGAWRIWFSRGEMEQGSAAIAVALDAPGAAGTSSARARVLYGDGLFAFRQGDEARSRRRNEEALAVARAASDPRGESEALTGLARLALRNGDYGRVIELAGEGRRVARAAGDRKAETGPLHLLAAGARLSGDYAGARDLYIESLELNRDLGNTRTVTTEMHNLGWIELHLGDADAAAGWFEQRDARQSDDEDAYGRAWHDMNWAAVSAARGELDDARTRFETGEAALLALGLALDPDDQFEVDWLREQISRE
jgi:tetratricopeptide (TPR) repeat protein